MKISTRINGRVTSISVKDSICALHYIICAANGKKAEDHVLDTCHSIMTEWKGGTARGASAFITDKIVEDLLEAQDLPKYHETIQELRG